MGWSIDKSFSAEIGHRVWAQKLDKPRLSFSTDCACKHLHGHSYEVKVFLSGENLDGSGMVTDFKNLEFMKRFLDDVLDHRFLIDINDPLFERITGYNSQNVRNKEIADFTFLTTAYNLPNPDDIDDSFVLVNWVPTSENICKALKDYASTMMDGVAHVEAVELWETKKSHCRYS